MLLVIWELCINNLGETLALALPDGVMQSMHCQTSDPKDIVVQLQESLQLGSGFLENPEPKTKQWIRCLAIKAKSEHRTDVVEYLRQIAPAGTTGEFYIQLRNRNPELLLGSGMQFRRILHFIGLGNVF